MSNPSPSKSPPQGNAPAQDEPVAEERSQRLSREVEIDGERVPYEVICSTWNLDDDKGKATASLFTTTYLRSDVDTSRQRPVVFCFNGGPGSSSAWLHLGAFGPRRVDLPDASPAPPAPWSLVDNSDSPIDFADLVFIDPVGTGFSRTTGAGKAEDFHSVEGDLKSVGELIERWLTEHGRWGCPLFLAGESYGTTRAAALSWWLTERGVSLGGVALISVALQFQAFVDEGSNDLALAAFLPTYGLTALHHGRLQRQVTDLDAFRAELTDFTWRRYAPALHLGATLPADERRALARELAAYTGLSAEAIEARNLRIEPMWFTKQLLPGRDLSLGRMDSRYVGHDADPDGAFTGRDPALDASVPPFTALCNDYLRRELGWTTRDRYELLNLDVNRSWSWKYKDRIGFLDVTEELRRSMCANPNLRVLFANGLYDMATPFGASEYTATHLRLPKELQRNVAVATYDAGHMMYFHPPGRTKLRQDLRRLVEGITSEP